MGVNLRCRMSSVQLKLVGLMFVILFFGSEKHKDQVFKVKAQETEEGHGGLDNGDSGINCNVNLTQFLPEPYNNQNGMRCNRLWNSYLLRFSQTEDHVVTIILSAPYTTGWVGIGFSKDGMMFNSSCIVGWISPKGEANIHQYHVRGFKPSEIIPFSGELNLTKIPPFVTLQGSSIYLAFQLQYPTSLRIQPILLAFGSVYPHHHRLTLHDDKTSMRFDFSASGGPEVKHAKMDPSTKIGIHGAFAMLGWGFILPLGVIFPRYLRHQHPLWFYLHTVIQFVGFLFGLVTVLLGLSLEHLMASYVHTHKGIGITVFVFSILQVLAFFARPSEDSKYRRYWSWYHNWLGRISLMFATSNIILGLQLAGANTASKIGYGFLLGSVLLTFSVLEMMKRLKNPDEPAIKPSNFQLNSM